MAHLTTELADLDDNELIHCPELDRTEKPMGRTVKVTVTAEVEGDEPITRTATGTTDGNPYRLASNLSFSARDDVGQALRDKVAY